MQALPTIPKGKICSSQSVTYDILFLCYVILYVLHNVFMLHNLWRSFFEPFEPPNPRLYEFLAGTDHKIIAFSTDSNLVPPVAMN